MELINGRPPLVVSWLLPHRRAALLGQKADERDTTNLGHRQLLDSGGELLVKETEHRRSNVTIGLVVTVLTPPSCPDLLATRPVTSENRRGSQNKSCYYIARCLCLSGFLVGGDVKKSSDRPLRE